MRIGIDIDGCIVDLVRFVMDYGIKFCYENKLNYSLKEEKYDEAKALGISYAEAEKFWNKYLPYYATKYKARDFASEVIRKLKENDEVYIITARNEFGLPPEYDGHMQEMVRTWLRDNDIVYNQLIFTKSSKLPYCIENKIDIMVEDSPKEIKEISTKIPVLCFDNSYNKNIVGKNITRVYSWYDVLDKIEKN